MQRSRRAARSVITDFVESGDDLLLGRVCHFHFVLCRHGVGSASYNSINRAEP